MTDYDSWLPDAELDPDPGWFSHPERVAEVRPQRPPTAWDDLRDAAVYRGWVGLLVACGAGALAAALGALVYARRRDLLRFLACAAICGGCLYGGVKLYGIS